MVRLTALALVFTCFLTASLGTPILALAQVFKVKEGTSELKSETFRFQISWPESFEQLESPEPLTPLLLRTKGGGFPTFNIISEVGPLSERDLEGTVLSSYRMAGVTDATLEKSSVIIPPFHTIELRYSSRAGRYIAAVTLVPRLDDHLILTFIDLEQSYEAHAPLLLELLKRFSVDETTLPALQPPGGGGMPLWLLWLPAFGVGVAVAWRLLRSRRLTAVPRSD